MTLILAEFTGGPWDGVQLEVPEGTGEIDQIGMYRRDFSVEDRFVYRWAGWIQ